MTNSKKGEGGVSKHGSFYLSCLRCCLPLSRHFCPAHGRFVLLQLGAGSFTRRPRRLPSLSGWRMWKGEGALLRCGWLVKRALVINDVRPRLRVSMTTGPNNLHAPLRGPETFGYTGLPKGRRNLAALRGLTNPTFLGRSLIVQSHNFPAHPPEAGAFPDCSPPEW